jgi:hypothetical protein
MSRSIFVSTRAHAAATAVALAGFPAIVVALNVVQRHDYRPGVQAISELALGRGGALMVVAFLSLGAGIVAFATLLRRTCSGGRAVRVVLYLAAFLAGPVSAAFHTNRTGSASTTQSEIHDTAGLTAFLLLLVAMVLASRLFAADPRWRVLAVPTRVWAAVAAVAFFLIPVVGDAHFGFVQRIFVGSFVSWLLAASGYWVGSTRQPTAVTVRPAV